MSQGASCPPKGKTDIWAAITKLSFLHSNQDVVGQSRNSWRPLHSLCLLPPTASLRMPKNKVHFPNTDLPPQDDHATWADSLSLRFHSGKSVCGHSCGHDRDVRAIHYESWEYLNVYKEYTAKHSLRANKNQARHALHEDRNTALRCERVGQWDGSVDKDLCCQAWWLEFNPQDLWGRGKWQLLTDTLTLTITLTETERQRKRKN